MIENLAVLLDLIGVDAFVPRPDDITVRLSHGCPYAFEIRYKGVSAFRQEKLRDGKWRKDFWYRFNPAYKPVKMDIRDFIMYLETIDKQRPDR